MTVINTYLYPNIIDIQILDTTIFTTRNRRMYARPITIYQGIDNPIQVVVKNQDQKSVNLTGYSMQAQIQDPLNQNTIQTDAVVFSNIALGRGSFTISKNVANNLELRMYKLTFKVIRTVDDSKQPVYIDDNYGVPLDLHVKPAYYSDTTSNASVISTVIDAGLIRDSSNVVIIDGGTI